MLYLCLIRRLAKARHAGMSSGSSMGSGVESPPRLPRAQVVENGLDGDTEAPDHGLAVADVGVDGDAVEVAGYRRSIVRDNIFVMPMRAKSAASRILLIPSCRMTLTNTREHYTNI
jgi:hypothetical protein